MHKEKIVKFVEKYYLTGINEAAVLEIEEQNITTVFKTLAGDLRGIIQMADVELENGKIGFYSTGTFLKMISILDNDIEIKPKTREGTDSATIINLSINDKKGKKITYATCDLDVVDHDGKKVAVKNYDAKVTLTSSLINDILKANSAIASKGITFLNKDGKFLIIFNYSENNDDKIELELPVEDLNEDLEIISFPSQYIKSILEVNSKKFDEATLEISMKGLLKIYFKDFDSTAEYWLVKLQDTKNE